MSDDKTLWKIRMAEGLKQVEDSIEQLLLDHDANKQRERREKAEAKTEKECD